MINRIAIREMNYSFCKAVITMLCLIYIMPSCPIKVCSLGWSVNMVEYITGKIRLIAVSF